MRVSATPESMRANTAPADEDDERVRRVDDWNREALRRLADEYSTPLYVTDLDRVRENYRRIDEAFDREEVMYAAKANTGRAVLEELIDEGARIECAAAGEIKRAIEAGADPNEIQYTAVNPPEDDLGYAVGLWDEKAPGMTFNVGAKDTVERLTERGFDGRLCFRVNPGIGAGHHEKVATGSHPKFGIPYDRVPELAEAVREDFDFVGLHAHMGSGMLDDDLDDHREFVRRMSNLAVDCEPLEFVDIGGGFGVPYRDKEEPLDLRSLVEGTREAFDADAELAIEPGRYVVGDTGVLLTRVNTVKETPETTIVGVDASMTSLVRPALYGAYHPIRNLDGSERNSTTEATVGGPVCESTDVFCENRPLPRPERGDILAVGVVGAYGYEMSSQFHSQPRPADIGLKNGIARPIRERETVDDITENERPFEE